MAMAQATQAASRTSYRHRATARQNARTAGMPLFQAFLCFSHQGTTDCRCIKDGTPIDPCMGSGHILVYMFDVLEQIYTSVGYSERDAAKSILKHNIYGLDIDDRAYQLAYFAVMMKARQYNRRILTSDIKPHVYSIQESNGITKQQLQEMGVNLSAEEKAKALKQAEQLVDLFQDAKEYGSILNIPEMDWALLKRFAEPDNSLGQTSLNWNQDAFERLMELIDQGQVMAKKYWITCTNPPYMGSSKMNTKVDSFVKKNYGDYKSDLFSSFIVKCTQFTLPRGKLGFLSPYVWMFIQSYEKLRNYLVNVRTIDSLIQFEYSAFGEATVPICTFTLSNDHRHGKRPYIRLTDFRGGMEVQREKTLEAIRDPSCTFFYECDSSNFIKIKGMPIAYWVSDKGFQAFDAPAFDKRFSSAGRNKTHNNNLYVRNWWEISDREKWKPYSNGGEYRKWYGDDYDVVNWSERARNFYASHGGLIKEDLWNVEAITWNAITSGPASFRIKPKKNAYSSASPTILNSVRTYDYTLLGFLNSCVCEWMNSITNPTLNTLVGNILALPDKIQDIDIATLSRKCIALSKSDWDCFEISADFRKNPLFICYDDYTVNSAFETWKTECNERFVQLKKCEEQINQEMIMAYGLQKDLKAEEDDKDVTVRKADLGRDIRSLISYAIGCIFGRYSLDKEGLIYAGGDWKSVQFVYKTFLPDADNVVPITDQKYLEDDVVERICEFLTVVYGADTLEENLDFIAKALGNKGLTSREVIRNYMLNDFFKDHCKTYSVTGSGKRPIYWLFDSGKQNAFKALVYVHRWDADTTGRVLLYAQQIQQKYETEVRAIDVMLDHITDAKQASSEEKRREHLKKQLDELIDYEERLEHMANERIAIDLDDGVKVNYEKVQTDRNGKKYQILAPIK